MSKTFKGIVENLRSSVWGHAVLVPDKVMEFYKKKEITRFIASINGGTEIHCAFIPNGKGRAYILLNKELRKELGILAGDEVSVKVKPDESKYGMPLPEEMEELFYQDPEGNEVFHSLTPGKQRSLLYMVGKPKSSQSRVKKAITIIEYLKYTQGKLDYKELNEAFKNSPLLDIISLAENNYNKRLFNKSSLRGKLHAARFNWMTTQIEKYCPDYKSILELGCFDGKAINYLPHPPTYYEGWDANWEGGLDLAHKSWSSIMNYQFYECESFETFKPKRPSYDVSLCMETLEHLPIYNYEEYIKTLAEHTSGYLLVTIPNEKKVPFVLKHLVKSTILRKQKMDQYSSSEVWNAAVGRLDKVKRINTSHKGFDYEVMIDMLKKYFSLEAVEGVPYQALGPRFSFTVGIVCKTKKIFKENT